MLEGGSSVQPLRTSHRVQEQKSSELGWTQKH